MVLDLGFLGDTVQTLPALWLVRQAYPQAELHFAVEQNVTSLLECAPWVDRVWGYRDYAGGRVVDSHVARIRRKLGDEAAEPQYIRTVHGVGYAFKEDGAERMSASSGSS